VGMCRTRWTPLGVVSRVYVTQVYVDINYLL
jgi:hypothetical protein